MDPRQPQHPFSRNTASPYGRTPFPPSSNQAPFPPSSHPPSSLPPPAAPSYAEHQRRPSDPPFYNPPPPRGYGQDAPPMAGSGHTRHQSTSSIGHGTPVNRNMPPPSSPQQQAPQAPAHHNYGPPPPPRAPPLSGGPPSMFAARDPRDSRDMPTLPPLSRPQSTGGSSMSISSMLGGPSRELPPSQFAAPSPTSGPGISMHGPAYASPRMGTSGPDYAALRRPQTPEHQRAYDPRDVRANSASAGSPTNVTNRYTPEGRKLGTQGQGYSQRVPVEERREPARIPNPNNPPPRPNSQPTAFNHGPQRAPENPRSVRVEGPFVGRVDSASRAPEPHPRQEPAYGRPGFEERQGAFGFSERERQERELAMLRERDMHRERDMLRDRERLEREREREREHEREREVALQRERQQQYRAEQENAQYMNEVARRNAQQTAYSRQPEPARDPHMWNRGHHEPPRPEFEQGPPVERRYEFPGTSGPQFSGPAPAYAPNETRYGPPPQPGSTSHQNQPTTHYEATASLQERLRIAQQQQQQQQQEAQQRLQYGGPPPPPQYQPIESPQRRPVEDALQLQQQQRNFLNVQESNRRGRASPLPQAVQGVQGQLNGPGSEPSIKNEFGKMFSGIGSGVSAAMGVPSPVSAGSGGMPFSNAGQLRREDLEKQDSPTETGGHKITRTASRGGRRRKLKEEESKGDDESSTGRRTPSGRGKRAKTHHHHHHHHHHRPDQADASSPSQSSLTPFKSAKGSAIPSPPGLDKATPNIHHHHAPRHHHHHVTPAKSQPQANIIVPLPKTTIRSQAVLDSVAHLPRNNLGHGYYDSSIKPGRNSVKRHLTSSRGFASTPATLPLFSGNENSIYTVRIPRVYLSHISREEITSRKALWGTDIYTDDSDVIAACIHQGWFRGAWSEDVDVELLDLVIDVPGISAGKKPFDVNETLTAPPPTGPVEVPDDRDVHVTILVLPALQAYASTTRFGIRSREWGFKRDGYQGIHDGLSFKIMSVKFVEGVDGQVGRKARKKSKMFDKQLDESELLAEREDADFLMGGLNGDGRFEESNLRGEESDPMNGFTGIGTKSWWKESDRSTKETGKGKQKALGIAADAVPLVPAIRTPEKVRNAEAPVPEPITPILDTKEAPESDQQQQINRITERMVANANTASAPTTPDVPGFPGAFKDAEGDEIVEKYRYVNGEQRPVVGGRDQTAAAILAFGLDGKEGSVGSIDI
ncbi:hypothetical protein WAI453_006353 [Rhynchosporium graminicola]